MFSIAQYLGEDTSTNLALRNITLDFISAPTLSCEARRGGPAFTLAYFQKNEEVKQCSCLPPLSLMQCTPLFQERTKSHSFTTLPLFLHHHHPILCNVLSPLRPSSVPLLLRHSSLSAYCQLAYSLAFFTLLILIIIVLSSLQSALSSSRQSPSFRNLRLRPAVTPTMPGVLIHHLDAPIETSIVALVDVLL